MPPCTDSEASPLWLPRCYDDLRRIAPSEIISASNFGGKRVVRTAPGVLVKYGGDCAEEVICTLFARNKLSLPAARILHHPGQVQSRQPWRIPLPDDPPPSVWYICMEEVPGLTLDKVIDSMTERALHHVARQLKDILSQMQSVNC